MKTEKINLLTALASGAINMYKLDDDKDHIALILTGYGFQVVPILNKVAYIDVKK